MNVIFALQYYRCYEYCTEKEIKNLFNLLCFHLSCKAQRFNVTRFVVFGVFNKHLLLVQIDTPVNYFKFS
jgi:hypothetical protein